MRSPTALAFLIIIIIVQLTDCSTAISLEDALRNGPNLTGLSAEEIQERRDFYKLTSFPLTEKSLKLLGGKFAPEAARRVHLPFWFNFEHYKKIYKRSYSSEEAQREHHLAYLRTCLQVLRQRVLYRILAAEFDAVIDETADWVSVCFYYTADSSLCARVVASS